MLHAKKNNIRTQLVAPVTSGFRYRNMLIGSKRCGSRLGYNLFIMTIILLFAAKPSVFIKPHIKKATRFVTNATEINEWEGIYC